VLAQLGRGGSAHVYRVQEIASGRELALKRLRHDLNPARAPELTKHLEREFYALAQLRHPRVIEVYDYGVSEGLPYYTMELLDGGDLRASAPLPWRRACELMYDVASSLALLHSRRFVHRDVTPSNIRCTRDGRAKLIDFGAMVPMGAGSIAIGTPAYVAPEVQQRGVLDASTDLFSLGATLYFTVTGRTPFAAADLAGMAASWAIPPLAPSHHVPEIPAGFDALVCSLLSIEPAHRPRSAFEVMQRLAALAGLPVSESANVSQGYLSAPHMVGRDAALRHVRRHVQTARNGAGGALWIEGEPGVGRSRLLELCTLEAKTSGASVLRVDAGAGGTPFAAAMRLAEGLLTALPDLARAALQACPPLNDVLARAALESDELRATSPVIPEGSRAAVQDAFTRWVLSLTAEHPIVIAIDDVHRVDEPTLACLATLAHAAKRSKLLIVATAESEAVRDAHTALGVLKRHSTVSSVPPLTRHDSDAMFASVFGTVPNLALLSERIFANAAGNPRYSLALAQYLIDQGNVVYAAGAWSLPDDLPLEALPARAEALFSARLARLGALARKLAEAHALSLIAALHRDDYRVLALPAEPRSLDDALSELIAHEIVSGDGAHYVLAQRGYATVLEAQLEAAALSQRHEALARLAEQRGRHPFVIAYHLLHAGESERALELLVGDSEASLHDLHDLDYKNVRNMLERALAVSKALGRPRRERFRILAQLLTMSLLGDAEIYARVAPIYRAQLEEDSGLRAYWARAHISDPAERLRSTLEHTQARYMAMPEHERVHGIEQALRGLCLFAAISIAIGDRSRDLALLRGLPALLEPFVSLSPVIAAIWENTCAACDRFGGRPERAHERWQRVYERLDAIQPPDPHIATIRDAVAYGLGWGAANLGISATALEWIERLDREPLQRVNAMRVRAIVCLQHGDWAGAERVREQAELMALHSSGRQLFERPLEVELPASWLARDLAGVKQAADGIGRLVPNHPGWWALQRLAQGYFDALRGDPGSALVAFDECVAASQPNAHDRVGNVEAWLPAGTAAVSMLLELGRAEEARARGEDVLAQCQALDIVVPAQPVACELALAEAQTDRGQQAVERVEAVIADQLRRGVSGLQLGASYEARACVAVTLRNEADATRYAALAAREYRAGAGWVLTSRYGRLLQEARRAGARMPAEVVRLAVASLTAPAYDAHAEALARSLANARPAERSRHALEFLCQHGEASGGYLYLRSGADAALTLVETSLAPPPSAALTRFVAACWQQQLEDAEMSVVLTELPWKRDAYAPLSWRDPEGERFDVLVLYNAQTLPAHVGLAVLRVGERRSNPEWSTALVSTTALQLSKSAGADRAT
jgi:anti-anti-sigma regulatory factor